MSQRAKSGWEAKKIANEKLNPHLPPEWHSRKYEDLQWIQDLRAVQCPKFRKKLLQTGDMTLVHNMVSDEEWGNGRKCTGKNRS